MLNWKRSVLFVLAGGALALPARAQMWGLGATYGSVNDVSHSFTFDGFNPSEYTIFLDYRMEKQTLLRMTYGSMWTQQSQAGQTETTPDGTVTVPGFKERINYGTVDAVYHFWEDFYTAGLFAGIGVYGINPQPVPPEYAAYQDLDETVFGWNAGADGEFRVASHLSIVLRITYHNVSAHPHRQFFNADAGFVAKF